MPTIYHDVFVSGSGFHLPGEPISNANMDAYIAPLNRLSGRIKARILAENGIVQRHYAIGPDGVTRESHAQMAAMAARAALRDARLGLADVQTLACGTSGGDAIMPGFANMVQGELAAPPLHTHTSVGVCAASVGALAFAAGQVQQGDARHAVVVGSDMPSRMFKHSRFAPLGYEADFNAHFLRWMLSDGAGALVLSGREHAVRQGDVALQLKWVHQQSFSGDHPVCMQLGLDAAGQRSYLDFDSAAAAERAGALVLRQDIRLLPNLFDVAIHEYAMLVQRGLLDPQRVDHFLCHYSSERFRPVVDELMHTAQLAIAPERWWTNLHQRGNTGAASVMVMLSEFLRTHPPREGAQIFCFVPESGRCTVAYALFEWVRWAPQARQTASAACSTTAAHTPPNDLLDQVDAPHDPQAAVDAGDERLARLLQELAQVWHGYRSAAWRTPLVQAVVRRRLTVADYRAWMECWIPQVREGAVWMRTALAHMGPRYAGLSALIEQHASDEQFDFKILFEDYLCAGGSAARWEELRRNPGGEALTAYLHAAAQRTDAVGLLGAIYVIEGTGQRIIPALLPLLRAQLPLAASAFRFLAYHGENDANHLQRWLDAVSLVLHADASGKAAASIVAAAKRCATLYLMQWEDAYQGEPGAPEAAP